MRRTGSAEALQVTTFGGYGRSWTSESRARVGPSGLSQMRLQVGWRSRRAARHNIAARSFPVRVKRALPTSIA